MNTIETNKIQDKLNTLHKNAKIDLMRAGKGLLKSIFRPLQPSDFKDAYLPVSREQGQELRQLVIKNDCKTIIEFGTSFGISTIYLADGARQTGGRVITTELLESKAKRAKQNVAEAGLSDYVEFKIGDAIETLSEYAEPIDFLFLDGWKNLYLPLFKMLEPHFHKTTLIYADNMNMNDTKNFASYLEVNQKVYSTQSVHGGKAFLTSKI